MNLTGVRVTDGDRLYNPGRRVIEDERWEGTLEKVEAVFREEHLEAVLAALSRCGQEGVTITHVHGRGHERRTPRQWSGMKYRADLVPRVRIEIIVERSDTDAIFAAICAHARTGAVGDGKIWVT